LALLEDQLAIFQRLHNLPESVGDHRYADGKWTVKEVVGHMADTERVFSNRLLCIVRADPNPLAGFDENAWADAAPHARRPLKDVAEEMLNVRRATLSLVRSLDEAAVARVGTANNRPVSARALVWITPGHAKHHLGILRDRYAVML
jgi:uncharacterized damage-inducible protein DinB